ncbi:MAG: sensor histidine kinase [Elusimicrobiota bacterium]
MENLLLALQSYFRFNIHGFLVVAVAIFDLSAGLIVLLGGHKSKINRSFFVATIPTFIWCFCFGMISLVETNIQARFWFKLGYTFGIPFISLGFYYFTCVISGRTRNNKFILIDFMVSFFLMAWMIRGNEHMIDFNQLTWGRFPIYRDNLMASIYEILLYLNMFGGFILIVVDLLKDLKKAESTDERRTLKIYLVGIFIAYTGGTDYLVAHKVPIYASGYISLGIYFFIIARQIIQSSFLDLSGLVRKLSIVFFVYSFLLTLAVPISIFYVRSGVGGISLPLIIKILILSVFFGAIFSLGPYIYTLIQRNNFWLKMNHSTGLVHELKSPLGTIQGAIQMIKTADLKENHLVSDYLKIIENNTRRLEFFITDLLRLAQITNSHVTVKKEWIEFDLLIKEVLVTYLPLAEQKNIKIIYEKILSEKVFLDPDKIKIVISNLLSNALKFTPSKGKISINADLRDDYLTFSIEDEGIGIPKSDIGKVFNPFFQGKNSVKGAGIGLAVAKSWIEAHSGKIWVDEAFQNGSRILFKIPSYQQISAF